MSKDMNKSFGKFLTDEEIDNIKEGEEVCDQDGRCYIKTKEGLVEKKIIDKQLIKEDGRQLLNG